MPVIILTLIGLCLKRLLMAFMSMDMGMYIKMLADVNGYIMKVSSLPEQHTENTCPYNQQGNQYFSAMYGFFQHPIG